MDVLYDTYNVTFFYIDNTIRQLLMLYQTITDYFHLIRRLPTASIQLFFN